MFSLKEHNETTINSTTSRRFHELDSLRGLAAFCVLSSHFLIVFPHFYNAAQHTLTCSWDLIICRIIYFLGHQAVVFFFLLSGFVLSIPFLDARKTDTYLAYVIRRVFRIYPPYLFAVVLGFLLKLISVNHEIATLSSFYNDNCPPSGWRSLIDHLPLITSFDTTKLDHVIWSLVHEMRISLLFPALVYLVRFHEKTAIGASMLLSGFAWWIGSLQANNVVHFSHNYFSTIQYIPIFVIGALLAKHRAMFVEKFSCMSIRTKFLMLLIAVLAYLNASWLPYITLLPKNALVTLLGKAFTKEVFQEWLIALGASVFIVAALGSSSLSRFLGLGVVRFLGEISYSLYLLHMVCLVFLISVLHPYLSIEGILVISLVVSIILSVLSRHFVEVPSTNFGKHLSKKMRQTSARETALV